MARPGQRRPSGHVTAAIGGGGGRVGWQWLLEGRDPLGAGGGGLSSRACTGLHRTGLDSAGLHWVGRANAGPVWRDQAELDRAQLGPPGWLFLAGLGPAWPSMLRGTGWAGKSIQGKPGRAAESGPMGGRCPGARCGENGRRSRGPREAPRVGAWLGGGRVAVRGCAIGATPAACGRRTEVARLW